MLDMKKSCRDGGWTNDFYFSITLHSLERTEWMMVRWMCGVSLQDRKHNVDLYSLLGVQSVAEVMKRGRLGWFGHVKRKS